VFDRLVDALRRNGGDGLDDPRVERWIRPDGGRQRRRRTGSQGQDG
jgi:hypothetical protein